MGKVKCINNEHWFGTVGKEYEAQAEGTKVLKDIEFEGDDFAWDFISIIDDKDQIVEIPAECFERIEDINLAS